MECKKFKIVHLVGFKVIKNEIAPCNGILHVIQNIPLNAHNIIWQVLIHCNHKVLHWNHSNPRVHPSFSCFPLELYYKVPSYDVELLNDKVKVLENASLVKHDIKKILEKDPRFVCASLGKIEKNMEFLRCTLGFEPIVLLTYPALLNYSVEKRMMPRYKVFQYLNSFKGHNDHRMSLISSLIISEKIFTERFLSGSPEAKMLYEKYKGRTFNNSPKITRNWMVCFINLTEDVL